MKYRLGVILEDVALALLRLSDRLRGTDHGPLPLTFDEQMANVDSIAWAPSDELLNRSAQQITHNILNHANRVTTITTGDYEHGGNDLMEQVKQHNTAIAEAFRKEVQRHHMTSPGSIL